MSPDASFTPRLNHVAMTMSPGSLDDHGRDEIRAFYGDVFGWTEGDNSGESGNPLIMMTGEVMQFVYLLPGDPALACPTLDHFGLEVSSVAEIEAIVAKAKAWQEKDERVTIIDVKARGRKGHEALRAHQRVHRVPPADDGGTAAPRRRLVTASPPIAIPRTVADVFAPVVGDDPGREALVTRSGRWSYAELDRLAGRAAHALHAMGVRAGDRVAGAFPNDLDVILAFHGAMRIGAVWVGVNRALAPPEKRYLLDDSGSSLLLCDAATAEHVAGDGAPRVVILEDGEGEWYDALASASDEPFIVDVDPHAAAGIAYTSGTTGYPKGAVHSQYNLLLPGAMLGREPGVGPRAPQGRLPAAHHPQHAGAHHAVDGTGGGLRGDLRPQRRGGRGRVDPPRAGDGLERTARTHPLAGG